MKRILLSVASAAMLVGAANISTANAADMALKAAPAPAVCTWCGWYIGLNAGWVGSASNRVTNTGTDTDGGGILTPFTANGLAFAPNVSYSGFLGGGQVGYNWVTSNILLGLEADFDGSSARKTATGTFTLPGFVPTTYQINRQLDWLSTIRARVGIVAQTNWLFYVTGGVAIGEVKTGNAFICPTCAPPASTEASTVNNNTTTRAGGTVGAGIEWMIAPHWSVKAEYLYANLGRSSSTVLYTYVPANASTWTASVRNSLNIARAGINWHF